ncbi:MAG TPA: glycosyltransferase family 4 protein [Baekduia sp.]|uniref:glycosyltransferase family 4 protein n=1 Tax=Baekduia sp. TaxID=2600305 RepID=UPI002CAF2DB9|nr:glycosyltransferase family 4 protein [Baekduia sp.]HMJ33261.1 glycosyltransferase family 4 protein [Baekduia sp.]
MRILIFHGYLLRGTGSNVYNALLATALARNGHDVHLLSQERHPEDLDAVGASGDWDSGTLRIRPLRPDRRVTVYRPDIGSVLPVYVADRYEDLEARTYAELDDAQVADYVARNVAAAREVAELVQPDVALANHLVMGPLIVARALGDTVPYAVKVHGSALEYTVKPQPERFLPAAREGLVRARTVLVGSRHTAESLWAAMDDPGLPARTRLGPPGVDVAEFRPRSRGEAAADLRRLVADLESQAAAAPVATAGDPPASAFSIDAGAAARAIARLDPERDRHVAFVGKLIVSKGVDLLAAAWPLVLAGVPEARLVVVGFGAYREPFERLLAALAAGDLAAVRALAAEGRAAEGGPRSALQLLDAFLDDLDGAPDRDAYLAAARGLDDRVVLTGRLEHEELAPLLAGCEAQVVPSTFPEAFGMVAVEAAACGALPVVADHSGLGEVRAILAGAVPEEARDWLGFATGPRAVRDLAERLIAWLQAPEELRDAVRSALVATARERFSWDGVADGVIAAARGEHDALPAP